ncbi:rRNA maturation RNase YbeY [Lentilitoribacter sp. EG35]|uniref:rRNA maturation RNase YbeY n=1 Tax=Lentilitoribacter sp. EG35 TaxID=3234192 RepID=UPI003B968306
MSNTFPNVIHNIAIEASHWIDESELFSLATKCIDACNTWLSKHENQIFPEEDMELSLLFTDDASIQQINVKWRAMDKPTNVLSFPTKDLGSDDTPLPLLGDIVFAYETIEREAIDQNKSFDAHLSHLMIHGYLHLFGFDHIEDKEAEHMELTETGILASIGLSNPYNDA